MEKDKWAEARKEALRRAHNRCQVCNSEEKLQVHHRAYDESSPIWAESIDDLTVMCGRCHLAFHRAQQNKSVSCSNKRSPSPRVTKKKEVKEVIRYIDDLGNDIDLCAYKKDRQEHFAAIRKERAKKIHGISGSDEKRVKQALSFVAIENIPDLKEYKRLKKSLIHAAMYGIL